MITVLVFVVLFFAGGAGIYWLLKSMGNDGIEAAAPGSCRSGKCGVNTSCCSSAEEHKPSFERLSFESSGMKGVVTGFAGSNHVVEDAQELAHASGEGGLLGFAGGDEAEAVSAGSRSRPSS